VRYSNTIAKSKWNSRNVEVTRKKAGAGKQRTEKQKKEHKTENKTK